MKSWGIFYKWNLTFFQNFRNLTGDKANYNMIELSNAIGQA
jgi:hypothetical protein